MTRAALALALLASGCAWSNRANRPVWNAFEEHLVPEGDSAFYASLPLTIPGGFVAISIDSFLAHPLQVVDDSYRDTRSLWEDIPWAKEYYTQLASLPFRTAATPIVAVGSFLGRCAFDVPPHEDGPKIMSAPGRPFPPPRDQDRRAAPADPGKERDSERQLVQTRLQELAHLRPGERVPPEFNWLDHEWSEALRPDLEAALHSESAAARLAVYRTIFRNEWPPVQEDPGLALRDPDPVVRYIALEDGMFGPEVSEALKHDLREDPSELVRARARERFGAFPR